MSELAIKKNAECSFLSEKIKGRIELFQKKNIIYFCKIPYIICIIAFDSHKALHILNNIIKLRNQDCLELGDLKTGIVKNLRDNYAILYETLLFYPVINFFVGKRIRRVLMEWDDLVDDLVLESDPEFRESVIKIAEIINAKD